MKTYILTSTFEPAVQVLATWPRLPDRLATHMRPFTAWMQSWRARRAAREAHRALVGLSPQTLRDIGAGPEMLAAAHARDEAARWRRLEMLALRGALRDPQAW